MSFLFVSENSYLVFYKIRLISVSTFYQNNAIDDKNNPDKLLHKQYFENSNQ